MSRYDRDLLGYGGKPPHADWPDGAAIAIQIVVNYEEGGERSLAHGDDESEAFLSEVVGAAAWPGQRHWNMESIYEYGARAGFWRLYDYFVGEDIPVTVFRCHHSTGKKSCANTRHDGCRMGDGLPWSEMD